MKFVVLILAASAALSCAGADAPAATIGRQLAPGVLLVGQIAHPKIQESSGIVASRQYPGVFWTHNDGGGRKSVIYAITRQGQSLSEFRINGAAIDDWEDIASDDQRRLYIGDVGNNDAKRRQLAVYQIEEPDPRSAGGAVRITRGWQLRFPKAPFDCESLFVWQTNGYVVSKVFNDQQAEIYRFPLAEGTEPMALEFVSRLRIDSPVTGADISADGKRLGLVAKSGAFVYQIDGDIARTGQLKPWHRKFRDHRIEACCFVADGLLATSESREIYLFTDEAFRAPFAR
jgi:hypothetical protein